MKIVDGTRWKNNHTNVFCKVLNRIFFNVHIEYEDRIGMPSYTAYWHYKKFLKHWTQAEPNPDEYSLSKDVWGDIVAEV